MPFDGVTWDSPHLGAAYAALPGAPLTAEAVACALVTGHYAARRNGRLWMQQAYERQERGSQTGTSALWIDSSTSVVVGGARGWIDTTWTHAVAYLTIATVSQVDTTYGLRVVATDGTTTATGTVSTRTGTGGGGQYARGLLGDRGPDVPTLDLVAEVSLATLTLGARGRITAELSIPSADGYALPYWLAIYLECRG